MDGSALDVTSFYDRKVLDSTSVQFELNLKEESRGVKTYSDDVEIKSIQILNENGKQQYAFYQYQKLDIVINIHVKKALLNPSVWIRLMRADGVQVTSWLSQEPNEVKLGEFKPGRERLIVQIDNILVGDGTFLLTVALFPYKNKEQSAFYIDPLCMWENSIAIELKRQGRPLSTVFDQPMNVVRG
jgi:hypothetical protein